MIQIQNGWIFSILILWPNILWALTLPAAEKEKMKDPANSVDSQCPLILRACEQVGRTGIFVLPFFLDMKFETVLNKVGPAIAAVSLLVYYLGYVRYFMGGRDKRLQEI